MELPIQKNALPMFNIAVHDSQVHTSQPCQAFYIGAMNCYLPTVIFESQYSNSPQFVHILYFLALILTYI
jgi:hypothetical protein